MHLGWSEILLIILLTMILFGTGKFSKVMQNLAEGLKTFKKTMRQKNKTTKAKPKKSKTKK